MGIESIKGVGPATVKKLDNAGVRTLADMREMDTELVAKRTGIAKRKLDEWRMEARILKVLDDVKGIGPATKKRLSDAGIHSLEDLAKASADQVAKQTRVAKQRASEWQKDAKRLLQQTQRRLEKEGQGLKKRGTQLATSARKQADRAAKSARKQASSTAHKGRKAADEIMEQVRSREPKPTPRTSTETPTPGTSQGTGQTSPAGDERPERAPGTNGSHVMGPGTNGQGGLLSRLRRIFQAR